MEIRIKANVTFDRYLSDFERKALLDYLIGQMNHAQTVLWLENSEYTKALSVASRAAFK